MRLIHAKSILAGPMVAVSVALVVGGLVPGTATATPATCGLAAHRGDHTTYTENSLNAMQQAIKDGADYLELDVRPDADGRLYLMHDRTVNRTTNGTGAIANMTNRQVRRLRLNDGERVPALAQVFAMAKPSSIHVIAEMKAMAGQGTYRRLARQVRRFGRSRVIVSSFHPRLLTTFHQTAPRDARAIISRRALSPRRVGRFGVIEVHFRAITRHWLRHMPYPVFAWTPDKVSQWKRLATRVRAIITNRPVRYDAFRANNC